MKKLRTLLAAAFITLPVLATDAAMTTPERPQIAQQTPVNCCWVMILGRWWCIPC